MSQTLQDTSSNTTESLKEVSKDYQGWANELKMHTPRVEEIGEMHAENDSRTTTDDR